MDDRQWKHSGYVLFFFFSIPADHGREHKTGIQFLTMVANVVKERG